MESGSVRRDAAGSSLAACSRTRTSAFGSVYSSLKRMPDRMSSRWRTVAPPVAAARAAPGRASVTSCSGVEHPAGDQVARDAADDRLRDRHEQVRGVRAGLAEVALVHQTAVLHDDHAVREGVVQDGVHAGARAVRPDGLHLAHRLRVRGEREHRAVTARDPLRGNDLAQVGERPAVVRGCLPVGQRHPGVGSRRKSLHEHAPDDSRRAATNADRKSRDNAQKMRVKYRRRAGAAGSGRRAGPGRRARWLGAATSTRPGAAVTGSPP